MLTGMEFWKDFPTNNDSTISLSINSPETWLILMNHSTAKLGLSYFPTNLIIVAHNSSFDTIPNGSSVITLADPDSSRIENYPHQLDQLIYGLICSLAGLWVAIWASWTWYHNGTLLIPRAPSQKSKDKGTQNDVELGTQTAVDFVSPETFHAQFLNYYYDVGGEEHQLVDGIHNHSVDSAKRREEPVTGEDVEELTRLVQKMYEIDVQLLGLQDARYVKEDQKEKLRRKREAMLVEAARVVESWADRRWLHINKWEEGEYDTVLEILDILREYVEAERQKRVYC
ncbi:hypothetical protein QBC40DRAFT_331766 [Triangularia verruculosa]|uniref:Uncharacterized protein n=1 Tax=Triangularia verruculosa TaxID=2587418 RepID=A0AAN7ATP8_9PEZI|nr:hypothetical protein QBC40DRAFT_331766 [Triangularia verruculosa]